jgi:hypothetical protein
MKITLFFVFLNSINVYGADNNHELEKWVQMGKKFGCKDGIETIPVNIQNKMPIEGACISPDYDMNKTPNPNDVTTVKFSFKQIKIVKVDEIEKRFTAEVKLSFMWEDARIKTSFRHGKNYTNLKPDIRLPAIWIPTSSSFYIEGMQELKWVLDPFLFSELRISLNSPSTNPTVLLLKVEYRVTVYCNYEFHNFPFDTQNCKFRFASKDSQYTRGVLDNPTNTHDFLNQTETARFGITFTFWNDSTGLGFDVELKRLIYSYVYQYYLPCFAIVVVSSISFIVPLSSMPARVTLVVTQFLTLTNIFIHQMVRFSTVT